MGSDDAPIAEKEDLDVSGVRLQGNLLTGETKKSITPRFCLAVVAAALGSAFQHGYNTGVINAPQKIIEQWINETYHERQGSYVDNTWLTSLWAITVSIFCVGGMLGAMCTGLVAERFGRKGGLLMNNIFAVIGGVLEGFSLTASSPEMIIAGRFFVGINCGLNAGLAPMYLTEISPVRLRGSIGSMYQLVVTISILVSQILGMKNVLGTPTGWGWLLALTITPAIFQLIVLPLCPESPRFILINKGQDAAALKALTSLRGTSDVQDEIDEMKAEHEASKLVNRVTVRELFTNPALRMPLIIAVVMMLAQQLSGINAVMFFSTNIFMDAGLDTTQAQSATLGMGAMNVLMTIISVVMVEKAGRKTLMMIGMVGMAIVTTTLTVVMALSDTPGVARETNWMSYFSIVLVIAFVVFFATGPGSIPWFIVNELFNQSARPTAASIAVAVNWTANFFVGIGFLPILILIGPYVFLIFTTVLVLVIAFTWRFVPETKNRSIEEITAMFRQESYRD